MTRVALVGFAMMAAGLVAPLAGAGRAEACGGVTATIAGQPARFGVRTERGPQGVTLHFDRAGDVYVAANEVRISSALAEAIARRYLARRHGSADDLEFEAFTYDHGDLVYMYHARVGTLAASVHVGPLRFVTDHAHVHVSATTGGVYGFGCGLGSGAIEMPFEPDAYPADLGGTRLPYVQFDTPFVATRGRPPRVDGRIEPEEWRDAGHAVIHVGTAQPRITDYG